MKVPSPLVEAGIEQQACLGLYRFHEAVIAVFMIQESGYFWLKGTYAGGRRQKFCSHKVKTAKLLKEFMDIR
ncbi:MAG: hypothetical protein MGU50_24660 [Trichodesmium sp. MAG_R02]|nr:hypothetical protein [Trichodesmium sp. MAG_R02]